MQMEKPIYFDLESLDDNNGHTCYVKGRSYDLQENFESQDIEKAANYYKKGYYEYGDILCQYSIAISLWDKDFVPYFDEQDKKVEFPRYELIEELSKQDNYIGLCATFVLAAYYNYGLGGVEINEKKAYDLIKWCAERGHVGAMYDLGTVEKFIPEVGKEESLKYLELASMGGSIRAKRKLTEIELKNFSSLDKRDTVKKDYDKIAKKYGEEFGIFIEDTDIYEVFRKHLKPSGIILDLGAGTGRTYKYFNDLGYKYIGLDFSKKMKEQAYKIHGEFDYIEDDMLNVKRHVKDNSIDGVFAIYSLFHLPVEDLRKLLSDVHNILNDEGVFIFSYQKGEGEEFADEPYLGKDGISVLYMSYFDDNTINKLLDEYGFEVIYRKEKIEEVENAINSNNNITSFVLAKKKTKNKDGNQ